MLTSVDLHPCFSPSMDTLFALIQAVAQPGELESSKLPDAEALLITIMVSAAGNTLGLYDAVDGARIAMRTLEAIARWSNVSDSDRKELLEIAHTHALSAHNLLAAILRAAMPSPRVVANQLASEDVPEKKRKRRSRQVAEPI